MKVGSLFTGYGGLDTAVGGELAWYAEIDKAACQILADLYPGVPNLGDITKIDWTQVEPVDVLTGGYPCQPFSHAGLRKGKNDARHLWPHVRDAIHTLRPEYSILENVSGHLTLGFANVLSDLATIGFDAEWGTFRASDVGAPHQRKRLFIVAYPNTQGIQGHENIGGETPTERRGHFEQGVGSPASDTEHNGFTASENGGSIREGIAQGWGVKQEGNEWQLEGSSGSQPIADTDSDGHGQQLHAGRMGSDWGKYTPVIRQWELVLNRTAPVPTVTHKDKQRLNPVFVEWMMGLDEGHVTGHGLSAAQELKMLGNGVVPLQARAAVAQLMERIPA
jgi:DNA (cytosine-5)-methyltransferase 1